MAELFLTSDPHFGHENIIMYKNRPFNHVQEMDQALIVNWNRVVTKHDKVFCLGDVSFYNKEITAKIISALNGEKSLILGNHDRHHSVNWWREVGFAHVYEYPVCIENFYWLSHEPMYINKQMPYVNLHGHLHHKIMSDPTAEINQMINLSVECTAYTPRNFKTIKESVMSGNEKSKTEY